VSFSSVPTRARRGLTLVALLVPLTAAAEVRATDGVAGEAAPQPSSFGVPEVADPLLEPPTPPARKLGSF